VLVEGRLHHVLWYQNIVGEGVSPVQELMFENLQNELLQRRYTISEIEASSPSLAEFLTNQRYVMLQHGIESDIVVAELLHRLKTFSRRKYSEARKSEITGGNCLIIPLLGHWESIRLLNTMSTPKLLSDVAHGVRLPVPTSAAVAAAGGSWGAAPVQIIFIQFDIYDIVLAARARDAAQVLDQIAVEKRPKINPEIFSILDDWYQCPVAFCCFRQSDSGEAKPLGFAFEPLHPQNLVVYTLDAHDGTAPSVDSRVAVDHTIFVGSYLTAGSKCGAVDYQDPIPADLQPYLLDRAMGTTIWTSMQNGDFVFPVDQVRAGEFNGLRLVPPFAPKRRVEMGETLTRSEPYA
jgi:hypothetical protein